MNAGQMVCHLSDAFLASMGEKPVSSRENLFWRTVMKWGAICVPMPWPKGLPTLPEVEQGVGGTPPAGFDRDRQLFLDIAARFADPSRDIAHNRHPLFGTLTRYEWMRWGWLHVDHHFRQFGA
jgi:hypothetical protein